MTELEIEAAYGPVSASYRASRMSLLVGVGIAAAFIVGGLTLAVGSFVWLRIPDERAMEQLGLMFVGGFLAVFVAPLVLVTMIRSALYDRLELRALGIVRRSRSLGLKHCRYAEIVRIEHRRRGARTQALDVFTSDGRFLGVQGFEIDADSLASDIERRAVTAGAPVVRDTQELR